MKPEFVISRSDSDEKSYGFLPSVEMTEKIEMTERVKMTEKVEMTERSKKRKSAER